MTVPARLAAFAVALGLVLFAAVGLGKAVGPTNRADNQPTSGHGTMGDDHTMAVQGLSVANEDFRLVADTSGFEVGRPAAFRFRIVDRNGRAVRDFALEHTKKLHLIVARRDLTRYQHLHPVEQADGSWTVPLTFSDPGTYRVFADFTAHGSDRATLGTDVIVPGPSAGEPLPAPVESVSVDGYDVSITSTGDRGEERALDFAVTREGRPVHVEPYLGADGHLVVLRQGDLAYLHAHPEEDGQGGPIRFMVEYPSAGTYRLFLQFKDAGRVHTVAFTQEVQ